MASVTQLANEIRDLLEVIRDNTAATTTAVNGVKGDTAAIAGNTADLVSISGQGFFNLSLGIKELIKQQFATNQQLQYHTAQHDIMICWLKIIAKLLCDIFRQLEASHLVQKKIAECLCLLEQIIELVHGTEAVEAHKHLELKKQIEKCCPPDEPKPKPCFEPCSAPPDRPGVPNPDYRPLEPPDDSQPPTGGPN
jgi:hypothetical protein